MWNSSRFQPGEGTSRGRRRDCEIVANLASFEALIITASHNWAQIETYLQLYWASGRPRPAARARHMSNEWARSQKLPILKWVFNYF